MNFWTAVKKYFGHDPSYKPWIIRESEDFPYRYVEGVHGNTPVQGFVVPRDVAEHYISAGTWPPMPAGFRNEVEGFWM